MFDSPKIVSQIECDIHNIQQLVNMLSHSESLGEYRSISATIKVLVKEIKQQKLLISDKLNTKLLTYDIPLFEVELPEIKQDYSILSSFFGEIN